MNREIKFRAWDGSKFIKVEEIEIIIAKESFNGVDCFNVNKHLKIPPNYLQQFTGRLDQNDKPIYEGDICYLDYGLGKFDKENLFEIVFERGCFQLKPIKLSKPSGRGGNNAFTHIVEIKGFDENGDEIYEYRLPPPRPICNFNIMVVIGNVFENPELLT